jgi:hypothetical protein
VTRHTLKRRLSDISQELVAIGERWWGDLYWIEGGSHGYEVRHFKDSMFLEGYATLQATAYIWGHADPLAWHVLIVDEPEEVGQDFVMIRRYPGIKIRHFYPAHTDDPVGPPTRQLEMLHETAARMRMEALTPRDKFLAELVAKRVATLDPHLIWDMNADEERFHLYDLDPDRNELTTWIALPVDPD